MRPSAKNLGIAWMYVKLVVGLVLVGVVLIFASQNAEVVTLRLLSWHFDMSQSLLIFLALAIGAFAGSLTTGWLYWRRSRRRKQREEQRPVGSRL